LWRPWWICYFHNLHGHRPWRRGCRTDSLRPTHSGHRISQRPDGNTWSSSSWWVPGKPQGWLRQPDRPWQSCRWSERQPPSQKWWRAVPGRTCAESSDRHSGYSWHPSSDASQDPTCCICRFPQKKNPGCSGTWRCAGSGQNRSKPWLRKSRPWSRQTDRSGRIPASWAPPGWCGSCRFCRFLHRRSSTWGTGAAYRR